MQSQDQMKLKDYKEYLGLELDSKKTSYLHKWKREAGKSGQTISSIDNPPYLQILPFSPNLIK